LGLKHSIHAAASRGSLAAARASRRFRRSDVAIFHEFHPPPYGGGNQFMIALAGELERRGLSVERNSISATARACLFNSYNFDFGRLESLAHEGCRMVHRVDGPLSAYRGFDDGTDSVSSSSISSSLMRPSSSRATASSGIVSWDSSRSLPS
jgi:hypothetical protein